MAALAGIACATPGDSLSLLKDALAQMTHRGGDSRETRSAKRIAMGAARSESAATALGESDDGAVIVVFDGVLYNEPELSRDARSADIPKVLASLYQSEGFGFAGKLDGVFALALWDVREQTLLLARDQLGTKPLFYCFEDRRLSFASDFKAVLDLSQIERRLDPEALDDYLTYSYVPAPRTLLEGVRQVAPGQLVRVSRDGQLTESSFVAPMPERFTDDDLPGWSSKFRDLLAGALDRRLGSNSNTGFLLSGGTDTAALVGCATKLLGKRVTTLTLGFPDSPELDERADAKQTAAFFGTEHIEFEVEDRCIDALPEITRFAGSPVSNSASLISHALFKQASQHVDSVVCGDGGNEIFGGVYKYNQAMNFAVNLHGGKLKHMTQGAGQMLWHRLRGTPLESLFQKAARVYFERIGKSAGRNPVGLDDADFAAVVDFYVALEAYWSGGNLRSLYTPGTRLAVGDRDASRFLANFFVRDANVPVLQQVIWARTNSFIPYNVMPYVEFNAVANGVEPLFPFLDQQLLDFIYRVPFEHSYGKAYRHFMRESLSGSIMPDPLFNKPLKGFMPPTERWLKAPRWRNVIGDHLAHERCRSRGLFDPDYVGSLLAQYEAGTRSLTTAATGEVQPLGGSIWSLVALEAWCHEFLD